MYFPKTGELETYWTNHVCEQEDCPGKKRTEKRMADSRRTGEWTPLESGRKRRVLGEEDGT